MILGDSTYVHPILDKISDQAKHQPYSVTLHPHVEVWENVKIHKNPFEASDSEKNQALPTKNAYLWIYFHKLGNNQ